MTTEYPKTWIAVPGLNVNAREPKSHLHSKDRNETTLRPEAQNYNLGLGVLYTLLHRQDLPSSVWLNQFSYQHVYHHRHEAEGPRTRSQITLEEIANSLKCSLGFNVKERGSNRSLN